MKGADCDDFAALMSAKIIADGEVPTIIFAGVGNEIYHVYVEDEEGYQYDPFGSELFKEVIRMPISTKGRVQRDSRLARVSGVTQLPAIKDAPVMYPPSKDTVLAPVMPNSGPVIPEPKMLQLVTQNEYFRQIRPYLPLIGIGLALYLFLFR